MSKTVAILGAGADRRKFGNKSVRAHKAAGWTVFPVHPVESVVEGLPAFKSLSDIHLAHFDRVTVYLPPATPPPVLELGPDGRLRVTTGWETKAVVVRRCFPWSEPGKYISLRDEDQEEVALIKDVAELTPESRSALELAMAEAGFVFEVTRVIDVDEEVEIRHWQVDTRQGKRSFQTRLDDWPRALPGGGFLIRDVAGDLYRLPEPGTMDKNSQELLWAFVG